MFSLKGEVQMLPQVVFANVFEVNWIEFHQNNLNWQKAQKEKNSLLNLHCFQLTNKINFTQQRGSIYLILESW